MYIVEELLWNV